MTRFGWLVVSSVVVAILGITLLLWGFSRQSGEVTDDTVNRTAVVDPENLAIYSNGVFGFSFFYPAAAEVTDTFTEETTFPWRANATATGTPIVRIALAGGEVRIGASETATQTSCERTGPSERSLDPLSVGTTTWQVFSSEQLGTENERRITSYRTMHEDQCFAIEVLEPVTGGEDSQALESLGSIIRNFTFAR